VDTHIEEFEKAVFVGEGSLGFGELAKLPMDRFDDVGRIDNPLDIFGVFEVVGASWATHHGARPFDAFDAPGASRTPTAPSTTTGTTRAP